VNLQNDLSELGRACFTMIWLQSFEHDDASYEMARICHAEGWKLASGRCLHVKKSGIYPFTQYRSRRKTSGNLSSH